MLKRPVPVARRDGESAGSRMDITGGGGCNDNNGSGSSGNIC